MVLSPIVRSGYFPLALCFYEHFDSCSKHKVCVKNHISLKIITKPKKFHSAVHFSNAVTIRKEGKNTISKYSQAPWYSSKNRNPYHKNDYSKIPARQMAIDFFNFLLKVGEQLVGKYWSLYFNHIVTISATGHIAFRYLKCITNIINEITKLHYISPSYIRQIA